VNRQEFDITLLRPGDMDGAYFLVPFNVLQVFGTRAQVKVRGTIDGYPYRNSIANMGNGHIMAVKREIREAIGKNAGDTVHVVMEIDTEPRIVNVPEDLQQALESNPGAKEAFDRYSYTHRKEYVQWIEEAKRPATRANRIQKAVEMIAAGKSR
jgi:hypothetical protein